MKLLDRIIQDTEKAHEAKALLLIQRFILANQEKPEVPYIPDTGRLIPNTAFQALFDKPAMGGSD